MCEIYINNIKIKVNKNLTVFQACQQLNIQIPRFCYHEHLKIAGNCRMCLVELRNSAKPVISCAMPILPNMEIFTNTPFIKKAREGILEFLLINHPLDCPICDQGGECDLQDQVMVYGSDKSRFFDWKRGIEDLNCGPFIKTIMTRCIHCSRCIRFINKISIQDNLGMIGRGNKSKISFYLKKIFQSEFSGNIIDLCPVGALTSKPYSFKNRPWELDKNYIIDIFDIIGTPLEIQTYKNEIIRILPKMNYQFSIPWITDRTRYFYDSLKYQRLLNPVLKINNTFKKINFYLIFLIIKNQILKMDSSKILGVLNEFHEITSLFFFKKFFNFLGINLISENSNNFDISNNYLFSFHDLKMMKNLILINCNIRRELPILNLYLKQKTEENRLQVYSIGYKNQLNYPIKHLGLNLNYLLIILEGKHEICKNLKKNTIFLFGFNLIYFQKQILSLKSIYSHLNLIFVLNYNNITKLNLAEIVFIKKYNFLLKNINLLFLYNTNNFLLKNIKQNCFIIYIGHHYTFDAQNSNLLIPTKSFFEKDNIFLNFEGRIIKNLTILKNSINNQNDSSLFQNLIFFFDLPFLKSYTFSEIFSYLKFKKIFILPLSFNYFFVYNQIKFSNHFFISKKISFNIFEKFSKILNNKINHSKNNFE